MLALLVDCSHTQTIDGACFVTNCEHSGHSLYLFPCVRAHAHTRARRQHIRGKYCQCSQSVTSLLFAAGYSREECSLLRALPLLSRSTAVDVDVVDAVEVDAGMASGRSSHNATTRRALGKAMAEIFKDHGQRYRVLCQARSYAGSLGSKYRQPM
jgi:hypothetical protein